MTFITWVAYVQKTYTKQVWSIVYLLLGAQSENLGDCVKILIFAS